MATLNINEIALEAHVSTASLMEVLNNQSSSLDADEVSRILTVVRKRGVEEQFYALTNRAHTIGIIVPHQFDMDFVGHVAQAVSKSAAQHGYEVEYNFRRDARPVHPDDFLDLIGNKGVIIIASDDAQIITQTCIIHNCPYVLVETGYRENVSIGLEIVTNNRQAVEVGVRYLLGLGHRKFAYVTGNLDNQSMRDRLDGYQSTLHAAGISYDPDQLVETDWTTADGYDKSKVLFAGAVAPTAVLCGNDMIALGVIRAAQEKGLTVGKDVSIIGFDDLQSASEAVPALTTLRQPMRQMGQLAFLHLLNMMHGHMSELHHLLIPTDLIVRDSTGPAPY